jgi:NTP pyrophosphatase (non-canonical NTP hydrolase)
MKILDTKGLERLKEWYDIGPTQRAAVELLVELVKNDTDSRQENPDVIMKPYEGSWEIINNPPTDVDSVFLYYRRNQYERLGISTGDLLLDILAWFKLAVPTPTEGNVQVQLGCHLEETGELLSALGCSDAALVLEAWAYRYKGKFQHLKLYPEMRTEVADALADTLVTTLGIAYMLNIDIIGALGEVNRSNWSKFDKEGKPMFSLTGKIMKGPNYIPPELKPYV